MDALRHDGLYRSSDQLDRLDMVWYWFYLWFAPGREVVLFTFAGPPDAAAARLCDGVRLRRGRYRYRGSRVTGNIEDGGAGIDFEGDLVAGGLVLRADDDGIGDFPRSDTFQFFPAVVPTQ